MIDYTDFVTLNGHHKRLGDVVKSLKSDLTRLPTLSDQFAIKITQEAIDKASSAIVAAGYDVDAVITGYSDQIKQSSSPFSSGEQERQKREREYDLGHNEGAEGFNPYRHGSVPTYWRKRA